MYILFAVSYCKHNDTDAVHMRSLIGHNSKTAKESDTTRHGKQNCVP